MVVAGLKIARDTRRVEGPDQSTDALPASRFFHAITPMVVVSLTGLIALYAFALEPLGFLVASLLFLITAMFALGERRIRDGVDQRDVAGRGVARASSRPRSRSCCSRKASCAGWSRAQRSRHRLRRQP